MTRRRTRSPATRPSRRPAPPSGRPAARGGDGGQAHAISRDAAVAAARAALGTSGAPAAVTADWWHGPRFTVRFDETPGAASTERRSVAVVDGRTGAVTATATTA